jgi:hypothetical protein
MRRNAEVGFLRRHQACRYQSMANRRLKIPRFGKTRIRMNRVIVSRYLGETNNVIICEGS